MTTVDKLLWESHPAGIGGERAMIQFDNLRWASVLRGGPFYTSGDTFEIAVMRQDKSIDYTTHITDDVLGYLSEAEANEVLAQIEALPEDKA